MNIYDFDKTLYGSDSTKDFLVYSVKKNPALIRFLPGMGWAGLMYLCKAITKTQMKQRFYRIFTGYSAEDLLEAFWDEHQYKIFSWYLLQQEETDIIISASPEFLLRPICQRLGIRHLIASRVDPKTGIYTGENCWGPEKPKRLEAEMGITRCDRFYSDSYSDQPLADIADIAFLIKDGLICPWGR